MKPNQSQNQIQNTTTEPSKGDKLTGKGGLKIKSGVKGGGGVPPTAMCRRSAR